jgi:hypothetical protein
MKIRLAAAAATIVALAACTGTPTSPLSDQMPVGPSFDEGLVPGTVSGDTVGVLLLGEGGDGMTATTQGDTTGRYTFGSGT